MSVCLDEAQCEIITVVRFRSLGYEYAHGPSIAPDGDVPQRADYGQVVLLRRLHDALRRINPGMPDEVIEDVIRYTPTGSPDLVVTTVRFTMQGKGPHERPPAIPALFLV